MYSNWLALVLPRTERIRPWASTKSWLASLQKKSGRKYGSLQEKWEVIHTALTEVAKFVLGVQKRRHPDWFRDSANSIFNRRNHLYLKWLGSGLSTDKHNFCRARSEAGRADRAVKNAWFTSKAERGTVEQIWREESVKVY